MPFSKHTVFAMFVFAFSFEVATPASAQSFSGNHGFVTTNISDGDCGYGPIPTRIRVDLSGVPAVIRGARVNDPTDVELRIANLSRGKIVSFVARNIPLDGSAEFDIDQPLGSVNGVIKAHGGMDGGILVDTSRGPASRSSTLTLSFVDPSCPGAVFINSARGPAPLISFPLDSELPTGGVVRISANERLVGLTLSDIQVTNGEATALTPIDALGHEFDVTIAPDGTGNVTVSMAAGASNDVTGNDSPAISKSFTVDTPPIATTSDAPEILAGAIDVQLSFNEDVTGLTASRFIVSNASVALAGGPRNFLVTVTPDGTGAVSVGLPAGAGQDSNGNPTAAITLLSNVPVDLTAPTVTLSSATSDIRSPFTLNVVFSEDVTGFSLDDLALTNAVASDLVADDAQNYRVTITPTVGGAFSVAVNAGAAQDSAGNESEGSATFEADFVDEVAIRNEVLSATESFLTLRADQLLNAEPDLSGRLSASGKRGALSGSGVDGNLNMAINGTMTLDSLGADFGAHDMMKRLGLWGSLGWSKTDAEDFSSNVLLVHGGIDYQLTDKRTIGILAQMDYADQSNDVARLSADGDGYMIGPYLVNRFESGLVLTARASWGAGETDLVTHDNVMNSFGSERSLYRLGLSGAYELGNRWTLTPAGNVIWFNEETDAYVNPQLVAIPGVEIEVGRTVFGPSFDKHLDATKYIAFAPSFGADIVYDFNDARVDRLNNIYGDVLKEFRVRPNAGARLKVGRLLGTIDGYYDGLGTDGYESYGVTVGVRTGF
jgi:hypothetical protein